jgi:hypothetical protein
MRGGGRKVEHPGWLPGLLSVFSVRYVLRKKKQLSIEHIIHCVFCDKGDEGKENAKCEKQDPLLMGVF